MKESLKEKMFESFGTPSDEKERGKHGIVDVAGLDENDDTGCYDH